MKLLELTLDLAAANIALDEALLETAESGASNDELLRLWVPTAPIVVLGRSSSIANEVDLSACNAENIPVIRRCSGGATVLTAPGCLMYAVLLSYDRRPQLRLLEATHRFVMERIQLAIRNCGIDTQFQGTCDLTIDNRKVSGNALRCKQRWLIYHGTLICRGMDLSLIAKCLGKPKREPIYRQGRSHTDFLTNLDLDCNALSRSLTQIWKCEGVLTQWPCALTNELVQNKYSVNEWNQKL